MFLRLTICDYKTGICLFDLVWNPNFVVIPHAIGSLVCSFYQLSRELGDKGGVNTILLRPCTHKELFGIAPPTTPLSGSQLTDVNTSPSSSSLASRSSSVPEVPTNITITTTTASSRISSPPSFPHTPRTASLSSSLAPPDISDSDNPEAESNPTPALAINSTTDEEHHSDSEHESDSSDSDDHNDNNNNNNTTKNEGRHINFNNALSDSGEVLPPLDVILEDDSSSANTSPSASTELPSPTSTSFVLLDSDPFYRPRSSRPPSRPPPSIPLGSKSEAHLPHSTASVSVPTRAFSLPSLATAAAPSTPVSPRVRSPSASQPPTLSPRNSPQAPPSPPPPPPADTLPSTPSRLNTPFATNRISPSRSDESGFSPLRQPSPPSLPMPFQSPRTASLASRKRHADNKKKVRSVNSVLVRLTLDKCATSDVVIVVLHSDNRRWEGYAREYSAAVKKEFVREHGHEVAGLRNFLDQIAESAAKSAGDLQRISSKFTSFSSIAEKMKEVYNK